MAARCEGAVPVVGDRWRMPGAAHARWLIAPATLAALVDMELTDAAVARYFGVEVQTVESLRARYGIRDRG